MKPPTASGFWVLHGDRFDGVIACAKWLAHAGDWAYGLALRCNDLLFAVRKRAGPALLVAVGLAEAQGQERGRIYLPLRGDRGRAKPQLRGVDGVVCGHIHHAEIRKIGDVLYLNDGDWVESCSALVEDARGNMEILRWADPSQRRAATRPATAAARRRVKAAAVPA